MWRRLVFGAAALFGLGSLVSAVAAVPVPPVHAVVLEVWGPVEAHVSWRVGDRARDEGVVGLPWRLPMSGPVARPVRVWAQSTSAAAVSCRVTVDGAADDPVTAAGLFAVARCER